MSNKTQLQTNNTNLDSLITRVNAAKDVAAALPEAGGGSVSVEYEIVNLTENTNSIPFTLKRLTATYGICTSGVSCGMRNLAHQGLSAISAYSQAGGTYSFVRNLTFSNGILSSGTEFTAPYTAIFINDPSQSAIYETTT